MITRFCLCVCQRLLTRTTLLNPANAPHQHIIIISISIIVPAVPDSIQKNTSEASSITLRSKKNLTSLPRGEAVR